MPQPELKGPLLMDAQTFLANIIAQPDLNLDTEIILVVTTSTSGNIQSFRVARDGWILGFMSNGSSNFGISINSDLPNANISSAGVYLGFVWPPATAPSSIWAGMLQMSQPVKADDLVNVRNTTASQVYIYFCLGYPRKITT